MARRRPRADRRGPGRRGGPRPPRRPEGIEGLLEGTPEWPTMVRRGLQKRCARCGARGIYASWLRMRERCPTCGFKFEREPGFFIGTYFVNVVIVEGFLFVLVIGFMLWKSGHPDAGMVAPMVGAVVIGLIVPVAAYPYARSIWSAIDLAMRPLELEEIADAAHAVDEPTEDPDRPSEDGPA